MNSQIGKVKTETSALYRGHISLKSYINLVDSWNKTIQNTYALSVVMALRDGYENNFKNVSEIYTHNALNKENKNKKLPQHA